MCVKNKKLNVKWRNLYCNGDRKNEINVFSLPKKMLFWRILEINFGRLAVQYLYETFDFVYVINSIQNIKKC